MRSLDPLEIGVMFWAEADAEATLRSVRALGVRAGQLGVAGEFLLPGQADKWKRVLETVEFVIATAVCSYTGESYADLPTVVSTVGLVPEGTRAERVARTKAVSDFAFAVGIPSVACHIGFIPHDDHVIRDVTRKICDYCGERGQSFALETGQEPAAVLLQFVKNVERTNLKINFDPANMILYGMGDPLGAVDVLAPYIVSVHCKDGDPPPVDDSNALGRECALGKGQVGVPAFLDRLRKIGYTGILSIEREEPDAALRAADIRGAVELLRRLTEQK